ncbi:MAG: M13 family metallopeptidase [Candidatus Velthaea sp.]|jgi:predicted metalloendopeptidase
MRLSASLLRLAAACALFAGLAFMHQPAGRAVTPLGEPFDPAAMDTSVNACSNFFEYATGTWRKQHPIPAAYREYGYTEALIDQTRDIVRTTLEQARANPGGPGSDTQKIGDFYGSCLDTAAIERAGLRPLEPALARIAAIHDRAGLVATVAYLRTIGVDAAFSVSASPDSKNAESMIAEIDQGGLGLPERDYYFRSDAASRTLRAQYRTHVTTMLRLSGDANAAADAAAAYDVELILAKASKPVADLRDPYALYNPMRLAKLAALAPHFAMRSYFADAQVPAGGTMTVSEPAFIRGLDQAVVAVPLAGWRAYLRWRLLDAYAGALPKRFDDESFAFSGRILNGTKEQLPRWKRCIALEDRLLGEVLGRAYVAQTFPPAAKTQALGMSERIRSAYRAEMAALTWLTPATKRIATAKLDAMVLKVGYPDRWRSYAGYRVTPEGYLANLERGQRFAYAFDKSQINKPVDHSLWYMTPQTVNAYNAISPNEIVLPAAQLQKPFFDPAAPDADNLGATGAGTVGHEMTHGFDDEGHKFDLHGNLVNWWTPSDLKAFDARANCVIKQFDDTVAIGGIHYQGRLDSGEAIADLGGTVIGYRALEASLTGKSHDPVDGFTPEQRYFLAFAQSWTESVRPEAARREALTDPHPLPRDRVNNTVANVPGWYDAFNCPKPPKPLCEVW